MFTSLRYMFIAVSVSALSYRGSSFVQTCLVFLVITFVIFSLYVHLVGLKRVSICTLHGTSTCGRYSPIYTPYACLPFTYVNDSVNQYTKLNNYGKMNYSLAKRCMPELHKCLRSKFNTVLVPYDFSALVVLH